MRRIRWSLAKFVVLLGVVPSLGASVSAETEQAVTTRTILSVQVADAPPAPAYLALVRTVLPTGTINRNIATDGIWCIAVESGSLTLESPDVSGGKSVGFLRAADALPSYRSAAPNSLTLETVNQGDILVVVDPTSYTMSNASADSSTYLEIVIASRATVGLVRHISLDLIVVDPIAIAKTDLLPADPIEIRLEEIVIGQGSSLAIPASAGPRILMVRAGTPSTVIASGIATVRHEVGIDSPTTAVMDQTLVSGKPLTLNERDQVVVQPGAIGEVRNSSTDPAIVWALSVVSVTKRTYSPGS